MRLAPEFLAMGLRSAAMLLGLLLFYEPGLQAATVPTLFNTGVDANGVSLVSGTADSHYSLTGIPVPVFTLPIPPVVITSATPGPGMWLGDSSTSAWISPPNLPERTFAFGQPSGNYTYQTTFDLTGFDPNTAQITGTWYVDNLGIDIFLNSHILDTASFSATSFTSFHPFAINQFFNPGLNTLDFVVHNSANPFGGTVTGLRVDMIGTALAVPLPSSIVLFTAALGWMGYRWRRQNVTPA